MTNSIDKGIDPMALCSDEQSAISVFENKRRVAWVFKYFLANNVLDMLYLRGYKFLPIYPDRRTKEYRHRVKSLIGHFNSTEKMIPSESMLYHPHFIKQAKAARTELIRRGGFWHKDTPESDIYMARLMGYGEKYIKAYIKKVHPDFKVTSYMRKNTREDLLRNINK